MRIVRAINAVAKTATAINPVTILSFGSARKTL
jgi:hypothetical protein